ncbi:protein ELYS-like isoform X2 [Homalodisca vitripennis]|uniref:protein ELYS-like isoform X2 n=1 Tax=Homalodisca vitripennis TaxID=197043 RepID=UPI001EECE015|nr:protein ELYS-like isoform X2 [Homalodisca vitripennis]
MVSKTDAREERLSGLLKFWNGIIAVGTNSGKVYLLDVWWKGLQKCIEDYHHSIYDEHKQSKLMEVTLRDLADDIECRTNSIRHGSSTLALWLNEETLQRQRSATHPGVQNILGRMPREFLAVSALRYFPQISTLAVGYNTSCFQLWDLSSLTILYTSALLEAMLPVFSFMLLEPSDDPRHVCYLWSLHHSVDEDNLPFAGMYLLNYREKHFSNYSMVPYYRGFSSCSIRYQLDLGTELDNVVSGRIISCQGLHRSHTKSTPAWQQEGQIRGSWWVVNWTTSSNPSSRILFIKRLLHVVRVVSRSTVVHKPHIANNFVRYIY